MAFKAAPEDQALLLDLQALDTKVRQLEHRAATLPERAVVTELRSRADALLGERATRLGAVEDARLELGRTEADVAVVDARIARDSERLAASSSVKDVQALELELAALTGRKSDLEDTQLAVMATLEEREALLEATTTELAEIDSRIAEAEAARDAAAATLESERAHAAANRATVAGKVPADLLALYEKQRDRYGVGASHLRGGVSSASGVALNATDMNVVRSAAPDDVLLCPNSNAVLVRTAESGL